MTYEKFVLQCCETVWQNLQLALKDLLVDLVEVTEDQLVWLDQEDPSVILAFKEKLDKEVSQDCLVCLVLPVQLDPKETEDSLVILVHQVWDLWDQQAYLDLQAMLGLRVLVPLELRVLEDLLVNQVNEVFLEAKAPLDPLVIVNSVMVLLLKQTDKPTKKDLKPYIFVLKRLPMIDLNILLLYKVKSLENITKKSSNVFV